MSIRNIPRLIARFSTVSKCPPPTLPCPSCPRLPDGLAIDTTSSLRHTMPPFAEQVIVCTGRTSWPSKIEDEPGLAADLKALLGRKGAYFDPKHRVSVINSSFPADVSAEGASAYILPSFKYVPHAQPAELAEAYLGPENRGSVPGERDVSEVLVLVCGHAERDLRCGRMGPVLSGEFERRLKEEGVDARVGLVSHLGGHRFAGNVVIYIPPGEHPLGGCGIWYGRVGPGEVQGLVRETVVRGNIVLEHFRGGIDANRRIILL